MTARVPIDLPSWTAVESCKIGKPFTAGMASAMVDMMAHQGGAQLSHIGSQAWVWGATFAASDSLYYRFMAHQNARAVVVTCMPQTAGATGTMSISGADGSDTKRVMQVPANVYELGQQLVWTVPVNPATDQTLTITLSNSQPHSLHIYEVPRGTLSGSHYHVDRSFADPSRYVTDDNSSSNRRGLKGVLQCLKYARIWNRRHLIMQSWTDGPVQTSSGAYEYIIGTSTAGDGFRTIARDINNDANAVPCRIWLRFRIYDGASVPCDGGACGDGTSYDVRVSSGGTGSPWVINNVNATGWYSADVNVLAGEDTVKIECKRAGAIGTQCILQSVCMWENLT